MTATIENVEQIARLLLENTDDLIYLIDEDLNCEFVNESAHLKQLGYSSKGENLTAFIHDDDLKRGLKFIKKTLKAENVSEILRVRNMEGYSFLECKCHKFKKNELEDRILIIARDISKFKKMEIEWLAREERLKSLAEDLPEVRFWRLLQFKDTKSAIYKTREMLDLVIDTIPQYIYWKDTNLTYLGCNKNYALLNNLEDPNYIIGKRDVELDWPSPNLAQIQEKEREVMEKNMGTWGSELWITPDGKKAWFEISRTPLHNYSGDVIGILSTYTDISERVNAELKLKQSELKYRSILENIKEAYFEVDLKGNLTFFNESMCEITGYSKEDILGENYRKFYSKKDIEEIYRIYNEVFNTGEGKKKFQFEYTTKDGKKLMGESSVYLRYDSDGNRIGFYGIMHDITEQFQLQEILRQSEEKYRLITENAYDLISTINQDLVFEYANEKRFLDILGYTYDEIVGHSVLDFIYPEDKKKSIIAMVKGLKSGEANLEVRIKHKNGNYRWIEVKGNAFMGEDNKARGILIGRDTTERKLNESKLEKSEKKYRHLFENSPLSIWLTDSNGTIIDCNSPMESKIPIEKIIGKNFVEILALLERPEYYIPYFKSRFESLLDDEPLDPIEFKIHGFTGELKWFFIQLTKISLEDETFIQVILQDITEQKTAALKLQKSEEELRILNKELERLIDERTKELKESEEKFRTLTEQSSMGIIILQDGILKYTNQAVADISEYSKDEIENWSQNKFLEKIHPEDLPFLVNQLRQKLDGDTELASHYTCRILTKQAPLKWIDLHSKAITYQGKIAIFVTFIDVTEKNIAEQKLKESEQKFRHLYENSPYGIVLLNSEGFITDTNTTTETLFGYSKADLINRNYFDLINVYPSETMPALRDISSLVIKGEKATQKFKPRIIKIKKKDGTFSWVESEISVIEIAGEKIIQLIIQDVTEKKLAEEKLKESERMLREQNIELKELDRLKTDFISIGAHELKTPLISVGGYVELILLREKELKPDVRDDLKRVLKNVKRLEEYINRLLDVMKIDAKKMELIIQEENLFEIVCRIIGELDFQISQKSIEIINNIHDDLIIEIDEYRISQVFSNILSNAIKFTGDEGIIEITANKQEENYLFKIKDNGKGLSQEEIKKLFGKFVTVSQDPDNFYAFEKGSGLGLYIAKGIIEAHGGEIWVTSEGKDKGAEFSFLLPIKSNINQE